MGLCDVMWGYVMLCGVMWCYVWLCGVMWGYAGLCVFVWGYAGLCEEPRRPGQRQPSSAVVSPHKGHGDRGNPQHDSEPRGLGSNAIWIFVVPPDVPILKSSKAVHSQKKKIDSFTL